MGAGATISGDNLKNNPKSNLNGVATAIMTHSQKGGQPNYGVFEDCSASMIPEETSFDKPKRTHSPLPLSSFKVELLTASRGMTELVLKTIHLRVSHEYLEFFCDLNSPSVLLRVPFEQIKSWKNTETTFEFEVIPNSHVRLNSTVTTSIARNPSLPSKKESKQNEAEVPNNIDASNSNNLEPALAVASSILPDADSNEDDIYAGLVIMKCSEAKKLALESLQAVNRLMIVMQRCGLSKEQISLLSDALIDASSGSLHTEWRSLLKDIASERGFSVVQALDLLALVKKSCPFDYIEFVSYFHGRLLSRTSFDMIIDSMTDPQDRENLLHLIRNNK